MLYYVIIGSYILLYIGMITYDLCHKDPAETPVKAEEEEVDISEEASQFKPVEVSKDIPELQIGKPKATTSNETKQSQQTAKAEKQEQKRQDNLSSLHSQSQRPAQQPSTPTTAESQQTPQAHPVQETATTKASEPSQEKAPEQPALTQQAEPSPDSGSPLQQIKSKGKTIYKGGMVMTALHGYIEQVSEDDPQMDNVTILMTRIADNLPG
jgi:cell division protein FtsN